METTWFNYISLIVTVYIITSLIKRKLQKYPPSPFPCLPVIGHLYVFKPPFTETFAKLANKYGPVVFVRPGSLRGLLISSSAAAEECFTKNDVIFCNRPAGSLPGRTVGYNFSTMNFAPYGPHWRNLRKIANIELLSSHRLDKLASIRADEARMLIQQLCNNLSATSSNDYEEVEMKSQLFESTLNTMTRMIFGRRYNNVDNDAEAKRFREVIKGTVELLNTEVIGDYIPYLWWLDWKTERKCRNFMEKRDTFLLGLIKEHRKELELIKKDDDVVTKPMVQVLLDLQQSDPQYYNDGIILGLISDMLIGGVDTTAGAMELVLSVLLNNPEVVNKAREEIEKQVGNDRLVNESDFSSLTYLQCIIKETLRMYPVNPFLAAHASSEDCIVGGHHVPRGTFLQVNLLAIQNDPTIWDDPGCFRPERFYGTQGYKIGSKMMPFGSGRRICPGEGLAIRVIGLTIGSLIQCFDWKRVHDDKLVDMSFTPTSPFQLQRTEPLRARLRPRLVMMKLLAELI